MHLRYSVQNDIFLCCSSCLTNKVWTWILKTHVRILMSNVINCLHFLDYNQTTRRKYLPPPSTLFRMGEEWSVIKVLFYKNRKCWFITRKCVKCFVEHWKCHREKIPQHIFRFVNGGRIQRGVCKWRRNQKKGVNWKTPNVISNSETREMGLCTFLKIWMTMKFLNF